MTDDNSKIPAQDMTSTDTDNNNDEQDTGPRVFDITSDLNIAPVKDDTENNSTLPTNIIQSTKELPIVKDEAPFNVNQSEKTIDIPVDKIISESKPVDTTINKTPENTQLNQFGPANPPAKTVGMNKTTFNDNVSQQNKNETGQKNLQEAIATIKTTSVQPPSVKIPDRPWEAKPESKIKPLRTYEIDFAEAMAKKRISSASIAIAEDKKREKEKEIIQNQPIDTTAPPKQILENRPENYKKEEIKNIPVTTQQSFVKKDDIFKNAEPPKDQIINKKTSHSTGSWLLAIISLILICGGAYSAFYLYKKSPLAPSPVPTNTSQSSQVEKMKSIISPDSKVLLNITDKNKNSIISAIKTEISKPQPEKTLKEIVLTKSTENIISKVTAEEILGKVSVPMPDILSRSLSDEWMLGVYSGIGEQKSLFIITTNNFFQNAFAGLIQWEKTMPEDLKTYIYSESNVEDFTIRGQYKDKIIKNKDVREYVSDNGHISFLYSFISNDKLVITNNEEALEEIIIRLEKDAFIR